MIGLDKKIKLLIGIVIVLILLGACVGIDSAGQTVKLNKSQEKKFLKDNYNENLTKTNETFLNTTYVDINNDSGEVTTDGKLYSEANVVKITAKPSCGCRHKYTWHVRSFENYCPNCHHYNCLINRKKFGARYEKEITCSICDSDFCGVCGKEKYSWSSVYLTKTNKDVTYVGKVDVI